ncbi:MAG: NADH-quinone oxidoreductase subunit J [Spirochaetota bacterium]
MLSTTEPQTLLFLLFSAVTIASALIVILHKNPVISAIFLVLSFFSLAGIYAVMNAIFIATMQVLVYAGAIMVLVIFVLMLLPLREETLKEIWEKPVKKVIVVGIVASFSTLLLTALVSGKFDVGSPNALQSPQSDTFKTDTVNYEYKISQEKNVSVKGNTASVGASTFIDYLLPFELISILLLAAVIGAVILAKKDIDIPEEDEEKS